MIMKVKPILSTFLLIFCVIGCGKESEQILQPEVQSAVSENGPFTISSDGVPAAPIPHGPMSLRVDPPMPPMSIRWHDLSQVQRNQKILQQAYAELLSYGNSCKIWVDDLVQNVSNDEVDLPPNDTTLKDRWIDDPENTDSEYCIGRRTPITTARPGEIVQLRWEEHYVPGPNNLHTFIVVSVNSSTITFIDSNWNDDGIVGKRNMSIADFNANVDSFTIYYIE